MKAYKVTHRTEGYSYKIKNIELDKLHEDLDPDFYIEDEIDEDA